jgi:hypothetical protein
MGGSTYVYEDLLYMETQPSAKPAVPAMAAWSAVKQQYDAAMSSRLCSVLCSQRSYQLRSQLYSQLRATRALCIRKPRTFAKSLYIKSTQPSGERSNSSCRASFLRNLEAPHPLF